MSEEELKNIHQFISNVAILENVSENGVKSLKNSFNELANEVRRLKKENNQLSLTLKPGGEK